MLSNGLEFPRDRIVHLPFGVGVQPALSDFDEQVISLTLGKPCAYTKDGLRVSTSLWMRRVSMIDGKTEDHLTTCKDENGHLYFFVEPKGGF